MSWGEYAGRGSSITHALYHLENVNDSSGNSRTLTNNGSISFLASRFNNGGDLGTANTTKYFSRTDALGLTVNQNRTCMCWVKMRTELSGTEFESILNVWHTTNNVIWRIAYRRSGGIRHLYVDRTRSGTANDPATFDVSLGTSLWHLVGFTFNGTALKGYLDGARITNHNPNTGNGASAISNAFAIGASPGGADYLNAYVDEAFVDNVVWSETEIQKYYTMAQGRFGPRR